LSVGVVVRFDVASEVAEHRLQYPQRAGRPHTPGGEVGELQPPEGFVDPAGLVVPQAVGQVGGDVGEVVGEDAADQLARGQRVDDVGVLVQALEQVGQPGPDRVDIRVRAGVRLEPLARDDIGDRAEAGPGQQDLRGGEQQDRDRGVRRRTGGHLGDGVQVGLRVGRGLLGQPVQLHRFVRTVVGQVDGWMPAGFRDAAGP